MPESDVGRNDPCPCGSGAKYKHCCLHDAKEREPSSGSDWRREFEKQVERMDDATGGHAGTHDDREVAEAAFDVWRLLDRELPEDVTSLRRAQQVLHDDAPSVEETLRRGARSLAAVTAGDPELARRGAGWARDILDALPDADESFRNDLRSHYADFLAFSSQWEKLEPLARQLVDEHPGRGQGYALLADALLGKDTPEPEAAVEILEEAMENVSDLRSWSLSARLEDARAEASDDEGSNESTEEVRDFMETWDAFWEEFDDASLDEQFELAHSTIDESPHFDGEWAFQMLIEALLEPTKERERYRDWVSLVQRLRHERPEVAREESGAFARYEIEFRLRTGDDDLDEAVDYLFSTPAADVGYILNGVDTLAYHGRHAAPLERMRDRFDTLAESDGHVAVAREKWATRTVFMQIAEWTSEDPDEARSVEELEAALGDVAESAPESLKRAATDGFPGPHDSSEVLGAFDAVEDLEEVGKPVFRFARTLVETYDWPPMKALFAVESLHRLWADQFAVEQGNAPTYETPRASEISRLRSRLDDEHWMVPNPDLVDGVADKEASRSPLGTPRRAAAFLEATSHIPGWLENHDVVGNERVLGSVEHHLQRRIRDRADRLVRSAGGSPTVAQNLEEAADRLD